QALPDRAVAVHLVGRHDDGSAGPRQAASEACGSASVAGCYVSPRVLVARRAITAETRMKMLPTSSARWKPEVRACARGVPVVSRWLVRLVDTAVKMAR